MSYVIEVQNLTKNYGFNRGVFDISFGIKKGEVFGFLGPNGAGKSTTVRHLMGFSKPQQGVAKIFGKDSFLHYDIILKDVGYIPGELALPEGLTGFEFIKMIQDLSGVHNSKRLEELLVMFKLDRDLLEMNTKQMSLGTKRKLAIVVAFMSDPSVLILDEPTSGLDPFMQDIFIQFIKEEKQKGKTILLSSHLFNEVEQTCDRISIIKDGRIVSTFATQDFKHSKDKVYRVILNNKSDYQMIIKDTDQKLFQIVDFDEDQLEITVSTNDDLISDVISYLSQFDLEMFSHDVETLEDYFLNFYIEDKDFGGIK